MEPEQLKRIVIVTLLFSMLIPGIAFGGAYNVLVYPSNSEISSYVQNFFPNAVLDEETILYKDERLFSENSRETGEKLNSAYKSENASKIDSIRSEIDESALDKLENPFEVRLVQYKGRSVDPQTLSSGDRNLLRYLCQESGADLLIIPVVSQISGFNRMSLYRFTYNTNSFELVFERISNDSDRFTESSALKLTTSFFEGKASIVRLDNLVDGAYVKIDGKAVSVLDNSILTTEGRHVVEIGALGYSTRLISLFAHPNTIVAIDASLHSKVYSDLEIRSFPDSTLSINGSVIGETPLVLDSYSLPLALRLEKDLYMGKNVGLTDSVSKIEVNLKPAWMSNPDLLKKSKDRFYMSFARSLLLFGTRLAVGVFNDGSNSLLSSLDIVFNGIISVSFVDTIGCLVDYFRQTEYISP